MAPVGSKVGSLRVFPRCSLLIHLASQQGVNT